MAITVRYLSIFSERVMVKPEMRLCKLASVENDGVFCFLSGNDYSD